MAPPRIRLLAAKSYLLELFGIGYFRLVAAIQVFQTSDDSDQKFLFETLHQGLYRG